MIERMRALLARLNPGDRQELLELLDRLTRPMTQREIERALRAAGHSKSWSAQNSGALKNLNIVVICREQPKG